MLSLGGLEWGWGWRQSIEDAFKSLTCAPFQGNFLSMTFKKLKSWQSKVMFLYYCSKEINTAAYTIPGHFCLLGKRWNLRSCGEDRKGYKTPKPTLLSHPNLYKLIYIRKSYTMKFKLITNISKLLHKITHRLCAYAQKHQWISYLDWDIIPMTPLYVFLKCQGLKYFYSQMLLKKPGCGVLLTMAPVRKWKLGKNWWNPCGHVHYSFL